MSSGVINSFLNRPATPLLSPQLQVLKGSNQEGWQEKAVKLIRHSQRQDPTLELARLREEGILTVDVENKMDRAVGKFSPDKQNNLKAMIGRVLEVQKIYQSTHDVLVHAQASKWLVYPDLIKELMKLNHPEQDLHQFKFLRMPGKTVYGIDHYSKSSSVWDSDPKTQSELISADAYFFNNLGAESALYFLAYNANITDSVTEIQCCAMQALRTFYPEMNQTDLIDYSKRIVNAAKKTEIGNLFLFCIPKEISKKVQYRSHAFGVPCGCHLFASDRIVMDELQKGNLNSKSRCGFFSSESSPQFRIFAPALKKEEKGLRIYLQASDRTARKEEKQEIRAIVKEIHDKFGPK